MTLKVLIVSEKSNQRDKIVKTLLSKGYDLAFAENLKEFESKLRSQSFNVLFLAEILPNNLVYVLPRLHYLISDYHQITGDTKKIKFTDRVRSNNERDAEWTMHHFVDAKLFEPFGEKEILDTLARII